MSLYSIFWQIRKERLVVVTRCKRNYEALVTLDQGERGHESIANPRLDSSKRRVWIVPCVGFVGGCGYASAVRVAVFGREE